jgi:hypothetical protein
MQLGIRRTGLPGSFDRNVVLVQQERRRRRPPVLGGVVDAIGASRAAEPHLALRDGARMAPAVAAKRANTP